MKLLSSWRKTYITFFTNSEHKTVSIDPVPAARAVLADGRQIIIGLDSWFCHVLLRYGGPIN